MIICHVYMYANSQNIDLGRWESGEDLGGTGKGEIKTQIYCMKKIYFQLKMIKKGFKMYVLNKKASEKIFLIFK